MRDAIHAATTYPRLTRSRQNNSVSLNLHLHILVDKSCTDDHGSCRSDITQGFLQRPPNRLGILLLRDKHTNAGNVLLAALEVLDGVDDLLEDGQCLVIGRVRVLYVSRFGVYRGRARDEDVCSFSDRSGIPELELVGIRGGIGQRPCMGVVWRQEGLRKCAGRADTSAASVECSFPGSLNAEERLRVGHAYLPVSRVGLVAGVQAVL